MIVLKCGDKRFFGIGVKCRHCNKVFSGRGVYTKEHFFGEDIKVRYCKKCAKLFKIW